MKAFYIKCACCGKKKSPESDEPDARVSVRQAEDGLICEGCYQKMEKVKEEELDKKLPVVTKDNIWSDNNISLIPKIIWEIRNEEGIKVGEIHQSPDSLKWANCELDINTFGLRGLQQFIERMERRLPFKIKDFKRLLFAQFRIIAKKT